MPGNNTPSPSIQNQSQSPAQQSVILAQQPVSRSSKFSWVRRLVARRTGVPLPAGGITSEVSGASRTSGVSQPTPTGPSVAFQQQQSQQRQRSQDDGQPLNLTASSGSNSTRSSTAGSNHSTHPPQQQQQQQQHHHHHHNHQQLQQQQITAVSATATPNAGATIVMDDQSSSHSSLKRRSNSNFTVPSISRTSITTLDTAPSLHGTVILATTATSPTQGPMLLGPGGSNANMVDTASIVTLASSSKHRRRRSFDTNASTRGIAPESIRSRRGSLDSLPLTTATIRSVPRFQALDMDSESESTTMTDDEEDEGRNNRSYHPHAVGVDSRSEVLSVNTDHKVAVSTAATG